MKTALIGYTGFVGSNLQKQQSFDDLYNSQNIKEIYGKNYDLIVCAGVKAVKWWANQNPVEDLEGINNLIDSLKNVQANKFILISTVDVYPSPRYVDENFDFDSINQIEYQPYGKNRLFLENFIKSHFKDYSIVRLPGLFGDNIKKNIIFDLLHNNQVDNIIPNCKFQYYYLGNLWKDLEIVMKNNLKVVNFNSEPLETTEIIDTFFTGKTVGKRVENPIIYDYRSCHDKLFSGSNGYIYSKKQVLDQLGDFIKNYDDR